jgi:hypothetical protein
MKGKYRALMPLTMFDVETNKYFSVNTNEIFDYNGTPERLSGLAVLQLNTEDTELKTHIIEEENPFVEVEGAVEPDKITPNWPPANKKRPGKITGLMS